VRDGVRIPLLAENVLNTQLATQIGLDNLSVSTTEHLLAALHILGHWTGFEIEVQGPEIPILDGSALGWALVLQHVTPEPAPTARNCGRSPRRLRRAREHRR
jgi:UDP-3-O-[3-hydroxymyristoyl] N-acetylglucosamine deacetylase